MATYEELIQKVFQEDQNILMEIDPKQIKLLKDEIKQTKTIQLDAMNRMQLPVCGLAVRLKHMGFDSYVVYDTTTPYIDKASLLMDECSISLEKMK